MDCVNTLYLCPQLPTVVALNDEEEELICNYNKILYKLTKGRYIEPDFFNKTLEQFMIYKYGRA